MDVHIPDDVASELEKKAQSLGTTPSEIVVQAVRKTLSTDDRLTRLLAPMREAFAEAEMNEDELTQLLEEEKHAMRAERRPSKS